jgi:hypothetical protein
MTYAPKQGRSIECPYAKSLDKRIKFVANTVRDNAWQNVAPHVGPYSTQVEFAMCGDVLHRTRSSIARRDLQKPWVMTGVRHVFGSHGGRLEIAPTTTQSVPAHTEIPTCEGKFRVFVASEFIRPKNVLRRLRREHTLTTRAEMERR